jgi:hypothetical protein
MTKFFLQCTLQLRHRPLPVLHERQRSGHCAAQPDDAELTFVQRRASRPRAPEDSVEAATATKTKSGELGLGVAPAEIEDKLSSRGKSKRRRGDACVVLEWEDEVNLSRSSAGR